MKSVFKKIQNLTSNCDVIISKFGQNGSTFRFTKLYNVLQELGYVLYAPPTILGFVLYYAYIWWMVLKKIGGTLWLVVS